MAKAPSRRRRRPLPRPPDRSRPRAGRASLTPHPAAAAADSAEDDVGSAAHLRARQPGVESPLQLAVVIPVLNEAANVEALLAGLESALAGLAWEAVFVDDGSRDGTPEAVRERAVRDRRVRLVQRIGRRGLASAVIEGMLASAAPVLAVMDGDLQHDEALLPRLHQLVAEEGFDLAVATRYAPGGSTGAWSAGRLRLSRLATAWSRRLLRADLSDPMSGFFAMRREAVLAAAPRLSNIGFKVLFDLVASSPAPLRVAEAPYTFRERVSGESKLDAKVAQEFAILLLEKTFGRAVPVRFLMFSAVGSIGLVVHLGVLGAAVGLGAAFRVAQSLAVVTAIASNYVLNNAVTYRDVRLRGRAFWRGLLNFYAVSLVGAVGNVGVGSLVYRYDRVWWLAGLAGVAVGVVWNYAASAALTWRRRG
ncbi:MAG: glycosyltransferase family 2 protein [Caulobacteraceae bacterium]|nr:glycosyltransferase family 2 protein [Caulobacter sp.]